MTESKNSGATPADELEVKFDHEREQKGDPYGDHSMDVADVPLEVLQDLVERFEARGYEVAVTDNRFSVSR